MFTINDQQMNSLTLQREDLFIQKLIKEVYSGIEEATLVSEEELKKTLKTQMSNAKYYGMTTEKNIGIYMFTAFALGADFDQYIPAVAQILVNKQLDENTKAGALEQFTTILFETLEAE
jgi:hypothetical protein